MAYKLSTTKAQTAASDEALRTAQFIRNTGLRLWLDGRGVGDNALPVYCSQLAKDPPFAARLNWQARQTAADRAWRSIARFYKKGREKQPGKQGSRRFQPDNRSVEYKATGGKLAPDGKQLTFTDGMGMGRLSIRGANPKRKKARPIATCPLAPIKRVRLLKRADGSYVQFVVPADRPITHAATGVPVGSDGGLKAFYTDSQGATVAHPRFQRLAETKLKRLHRRVSPKPKRSKNRKKASKRRAQGYLQVHRQRQDFARKTARALITSSDMIAYEDRCIAHLVKNHPLAKSSSEAAWGLFLSWVRNSGKVHQIPVSAVSPKFPTQDGSGGGLRVKKSLSQRPHLCPNCGLILDRDWNAALNLLAAAQAKLAAHRTAGQAGTGSPTGEQTASGQTASTHVFARARRKRAE